jgi:Family of unknown function (DUF6272)
MSQSVLSLMEKKKFSFYHHYINLSHEDVIVSYKGPFSSTIMYEMSKEIQNRLVKDLVAGKKVYSIFMELAQNIFNYSAEVNKFGIRNEGIGTIVVTESQELYSITAGNLVSRRAVPILVDKCQLINNSDRETLRRLKFEEKNRTGAANEFSKGAGVGLIHIALTSAEPLEAEVAEINEEISFFAISVNVKKKAA